MNYFTYYKQLLAEANPRAPGPVGVPFTKFETLLYWLKTPGQSLIAILAPVFTNSNDNQKNRTISLPNQQKVRFWTFAEREISKEILDDENVKKSYTKAIINVLLQKKNFIKICLMPYNPKLISDITILGNQLNRTYSSINTRTAKGLTNLNFLLFIRNGTSIDILLEMIGAEKLETQNPLAKTNNTTKISLEKLEEIKKEMFSSSDEKTITPIDKINSREDINTFIAGLSKYFKDIDQETLIMDLFCSKLPILKVDTDEKETINLNELEPDTTELSNPEEPKKKS